MAGKIGSHVVQAFELSGSVYIYGIHFSKGHCNHNHISFPPLLHLPVLEP
jgi:hypothetical protein